MRTIQRILLLFAINRVWRPAIRIALRISNGRECVSTDDQRTVRRAKAAIVL
jgi:hypothetical protein